MAQAAEEASEEPWLCCCCRVPWVAGGCLVGLPRLAEEAVQVSGEEAEQAE